MLRLVAEGVVSLRALNAEPRKAIFRVRAGKSVGRQVVRRCFFETWKCVNGVIHEGSERGKSSYRLLVVMDGQAEKALVTGSTTGFG
jgi:hypothetical protein